ncbi:hypothetical protein TOPH_04184 [Tolypocladium ophioglossoides CBS 100239]|uniref:Helix-turn-helix domain-containing protein n=1 Tax=Tolypocladium ophioglossoides (strain CBS 100239) TaxID=1163406 RepID=A0A0L0NB21_TOLOC|nr:hypothetical protein TOPH_04184 [Tolypocladium ophioglossoides CBS 100239]
MGSSSSKTAAAASRGAAARQFPSRAPGASIPHRTPRTRTEPRSKPKPPLGDGTKDQDPGKAQQPNANPRSVAAIRADAMDPDFASGGFSQRLHQMGIVQPNPTFSPSSTAVPQASTTTLQAPAAPIFPSARNNTTLSVLEARRALQQRADEDLEKMGRYGSQGRRFLDMRAALDAMQMRHRGVPSSDIEQRLRLEPGIMDRLGRRQVLTHVSTNK